MIRIIAAFAIAATVGSTGSALSSAERPWDKWEQIIWTASCETFRTPHHGGVTPCDGAKTEVYMTKVYNDGSASFSFTYVKGIGRDGGENSEEIFFETAPPAVQGLYPITEVQDEVSDGPIKTFGSCDMRGGDKIRCASGGGDNKIMIVYHLISQDTRAICAMDADGVSADLSRCAFPNGGRSWDASVGPPRPLEEIK